MWEVSVPFLAVSMVRWRKRSFQTGARNRIANMPIPERSVKHLHSSLRKKDTNIESILNTFKTFSWFFSRKFEDIFRLLRWDLFAHDLTRRYRTKFERDFRTRADL